MSMKSHLTGSCAMAIRAICIATTFLPPVISHAKELGAARPITVEDIIGIRKIGKIAVSPNGGMAAYLVVQAIIQRDAYSIKLVVTSAEDTTRHEVITQVEVPATRSAMSDAWEDIGQNLTGDIVFAWDSAGNDLLYGVSGHGSTALFRYSPMTQSTIQISTVNSTVTRLSSLDNHELGYCVNHLSQQVIPKSGELPDPAYRYEEATFDFSAKEPWRGSKSIVNDDGSSIDRTENLDCFQINELTKTKSVVPSSTVIEILDPRWGRYSGFAGKKYNGDIVNSAKDSPDGKYVLYGASEPQIENASWVGKGIFFVEEVQEPHTQKHLFDIVGRQEGGIHQIFWEPDSKAILCVRDSLDGSKLVRIDIATGKETILMESEWRLDHPMLSANGRFLYVTREKPTVPKQLSRIDLSTGQMELIDNENPEFNSLELPQYTPVRQSNHYEDELTGYLFLPPGFHGQKRLPFVAIKGQDWDGLCDGGTGVEFPGMVMAMKGYAVLFFLPGTKHFGDSRKGDATYSLLRLKSPIESLGLVIADLDKRGWVDPEKTGIAGLSYGADLVDYASGFSNIFAVGTATTGDVEAPANYFMLGMDSARHFAQRFGLPYPDEAGLSTWKKVSASLNASQSRMPLLFQPPDSEAWPSIPQHLAWQHAGVPVETYVYPDEGHIKVHPLNRYYVMTRNSQWFDFWLRDVEDPRPEFADQFKRWEKMRDVWQAKLAVEAKAGSSNPK